MMASIVVMETRVRRPPASDQTIDLGSNAVLSYKCRVFAEDRQMRKSLKTAIADRVANSEDFVFLTREFLDLGGRDQVSRALRKLCDDGILLRIGVGLYVKARRSSISGEPIAARTPSTVLRMVFDKLGVPWRESRSIAEYNLGLSTQIPVNPIATVFRFNRKITVNGIDLDYDTTRNRAAVDDALYEVRQRIKGYFKSFPGRQSWRAFSLVGSRKEVQKVLRQLCKQKFIIRLEDGTYMRRQPIKRAAKAPRPRRSSAA
jgi:hypothetical protein